MLKILIKIRSLATVTKPVLNQQRRGLPLITCKRKEFDCFTGDVAGRENTKFGNIPLASDGWKHHKSKGDFFVIHPTEECVSSLQNRVSVDTLTALNFDPQLLENLKNHLDITKLIQIQSDGIPKIKDMNHVLIAAETGCGKTLTYLLPIVQQILEQNSRGQKRDLNTPLALIITPGRELATQIGQVAEKLVNGLGINVKTVLGGRTKQHMLNPDFEDIDILVASMGALSKLVTTGIFRVNHVRHVVLDEADTLLDDSFSEKLEYFLRRFPFHKNHLEDLSRNIIGTQLVLASATMPSQINELLAQIIDVETIQEVLSPNLHRLMTHVKQKFIRLTKSDRPLQLLTIVKEEIRKNRPLIIFSNKSVTSDFVSIYLNERGVNCTSLNGDLLMKIRLGKFEQFQNGEFDVLSTTDVASRGLDTTRARHVINFDFPIYVADYIHRCGRIGRINSHESCLLTNFVSSQHEVNTVQRIEHCARTQQILPRVNANITGIIKKRILKQLGDSDLLLEKNEK